MTLSEELKWRGFINQTTLKDVSWLNKPKTVYFGVDPSADSLHVGNLASLMPMRHMIDSGWEVVLLVGGATGMIGDPGGKNSERNLLTPREIKHNKREVARQVKELFAGQKFTLVDNYDWLSRLSLLDFLRETGKHFSMTTLVQRDFIAQRIGKEGSGISFAEFSYTLLQGYDYWHLFKKYGAVLQYGGSDQWGNMLSGVDLVRRKEGKQVHVLAGPLVVDKETGKKFGKSEEGAVWLDGGKTSINQFYQFWLNVSDEAVQDFLGYFTLLSKAQVDDVIEKFNKDRSSRLAQKTLAFEVTKVVHGAPAAVNAKEHAESLKISIGKSSDTTFEAAVGDSVVDLLVNTSLASSKTEARKILASAGVYINDSPKKGETLVESDFTNGIMKLRRGKKLQNTVFIALK